MEKNKKSAVKDRSTSYLLMIDRPVLIFAICVVALWLSARMGVYWCTKSGKLEEDERADLGVILTAALTLLGLIIGFSFSMAISRYDQRKYNEAAEANAIGTEFARAGLLPETDVARTRELLRKYLINVSCSLGPATCAGLQQIDLSTAQLQRGPLVHGSGLCLYRTNRHGRSGCFGYERCIELASVHAGSVVEPYPSRGVGADGGDSHLLQLHTRLYGTTTSRPDQAIPYCCR